MQSEKYSYVEKTKHGFTTLVAYPHPQGGSTLEGLYDWESADQPNRLMVVEANEQCAKDTLKSLIIPLHNI